ncbi:PREDICTED: uncharacterized protein LOC109333185 isoform X2 [Lupinus angustifolius]|uniref:uncharacterized protein LOC109333185 isoform X2 n=1 Tax=Lupinus angustifolius TaxID=3871 RepID=UPI00092F07FD|nr:PREDICTED: uncharacterized protein LOC109333185 isoform X2 [Lupinus angustifolius]
MNPRISFSNDFVESKQPMKQDRSFNNRSETPTPVVSSDFEFSSSSMINYSMMSSADELLFKGRLLPYKDNNNNQMHRATTTLREELLVDDDDDDGIESQGFSLRPQKGSSTRWKGFLGLRKSHIGSKNKTDKSEASSDKGVEVTRSALEGSPLSQCDAGNVE